MSVACHSVGFHVLVHFAEQVGHLGASSCTGGTGLGIHDQGVHINHAFLDHGIGRQDRTGSVAAGVGYQSGLLRDLVTIDLAESVYCFLNELRRFVLDAVPFFIGGHILDPVISRQIHDLHLRENLLCQKARQKSLRGCGKDHIYLLRQFFQIVILADILHQLEHVLVYLIILLIYIASGTVPYDFGILVV